MAVIKRQSLGGVDLIHIDNTIAPVVDPRVAGLKANIGSIVIDERGLGYHMLKFGVGDADWILLNYETYKLQHFNDEVTLDENQGLTPGSTLINFGLPLDDESYFVNAKVVGRQTGSGASGSPEGAVADSFILEKSVLAIQEGGGGGTLTLSTVHTDKKLYAKTMDAEFDLTFSAPDPQTLRLTGINGSDSGSGDSGRVINWQISLLVSSKGLTFPS